MWNWVDKLVELKNQPLALATIAHVKGSAPRNEGAKVIVLSDGTFFGTIGGGNLEKQVLEDAQRYLKEDRTQSIHYTLCESTGQCCGGVVDVLIEVLNMNPKVYIFGAGHVGQALCRTLVGTIFAVHAIDQELIKTHYGKEDLL